jgi:uncharacterized peroxidase-related enzyme
VQYQVHSGETAPEGSKQTVDKFITAWGFLPNLGGVLAESPAALELLWQGYSALSAKATLSAIEQNVVAIAVSREGRCNYCVAAHSTLAAGAGIDSDTLEAVRSGRAVQDHKLEALRATAQRLAQGHGWLTAAEQARFLAAGYSKGQLLEVIGWASLKTLTNYVNHVAQTPVDAQWQSQRWDQTEPVAA